MFFVLEITVKVLLSALHGTTAFVNIVPFYGYIFHTIKCFDLLLRCRFSFKQKYFNCVSYITVVCMQAGELVCFFFLSSSSNNSTLCIDFTVIWSLIVRRQKDECSISCTIKHNRPLMDSSSNLLSEVQSLKLVWRSRKYEIPSEMVRSPEISKHKKSLKTAVVVVILM